MLLVYALPFLPVLVTTGLVQPTMMQDVAEPRLEDSRALPNWLSHGLMNFLEVPLSTAKSVNEARRRKKLKLNKYLLPLIIGFILIKSILLPVALKTLAVLSGKAVVLSLMSLILAAIVGLKRIAQSPPGHNYDVNAPSSKYRRQDMYNLPEEDAEREPYKYYRERRRKK
ncbi:hypothetical protein KM043_006774 [Ampulex compressa]|nr:hypothetical protein KM043_006774 [Ampulex compressa]